MEWFAFLIYFLTATCGALVVWFAIKVGCRASAPAISEFPEVTEIAAAETVPAEETPCLYWNFTSALIVVPILLLVLGIAARNLPVLNPVTSVLAGALALIWLMSLWSGMLSFPPQVPAEDAVVPPDFSAPEPAAPERFESEQTDFNFAQWPTTDTTDTREVP
tara:strand:- start:141070 stop:141558 length:489 start_codon:yes stop_codon:yes gene_type:complete